LVKSKSQTEPIQTETTKNTFGSDVFGSFLYSTVWFGLVLNTSDDTDEARKLWERNVFFLKNMGEKCWKCMVGKIKTTNRTNSN